MAVNRSSPGSGKNPTKDAILEAAILLLDKRGADGFTVDEVLIESSSSASSLYHHFGNREGLLLAVEEARYRRRLRGEDRKNLAGGLDAQTTEEFFEHVAVQIRRIITDPLNVDVRRDRLQVAARALDSPALAKQTKALQDRLIDAVAAMFEAAQARGLIAADLDTRAYSAWFHGMTLGRTFTEDTLGAEAWLAVPIPAALAPLRPSTPAFAPNPGNDEPTG